MENILIVSYSDKGLEIIVDILHSISCETILIAKTCDEARRLAQQNQFDLFIINSPVYNETGRVLAKELITNTTSQVMFIVKEEKYEESSNLLEELGIVTMLKPLDKELLIKTLKIIKATSIKLKKISKKNEELSQKIEDIKFIDRAKCLLISHLSMSETEAHKYIEKEAMNTRTSRINIARSILKTYDY